MEETNDYHSLLPVLRKAYDARVQEREQSPPADWKLAQSQMFLERLRAAGLRTLLEIGAGTGVHAQFFQRSGLQVVCCDLSPAMVASCRAKGLQAYVMDFLGLDFPDGEFDAVFAMNCLLHVPKANFPDALRSVRRVLRPGGLIFLGQFGGRDFEGVYEQDHYEPKRFYSFFPDPNMQQVCQDYFELLDFSIIELPDDEEELHFQALTLRKPVEGEVVSDV